MPRYSLKPHNLSPETWLYDDKKGVLVVHEFRDKTTARHYRTDQFVIPWANLRAALKRHDAK